MAAAPSRGDETLTTDSSVLGRHAEALPTTAACPLGRCAILLSR